MNLAEKPGAEQALPFHGYYFRLIARGRDHFAAIAYPVTYRSSGVMTFLVDHNNVVYERDLGAHTDRLALKYNLPDSNWVPAEEPANP